MAGATAAAVRSIKELLLERGLRPGDPMPPEQELVDALGVSRSSVREAVRTLVALDILEVRHGVGTFVGQLSMRPFVESMVFRGVLQPEESVGRLREIVELRRGLDLAYASGVLAGISPEHATALRELVNEMRASAERGESFRDADRAFHLALADCAENRLYGQLVAALWDIHSRVEPSLEVVIHRELTTTAHAHAQLLERALDGDLERYLDAVREHYEPIARVLASRFAPELA